MDFTLIGFGYLLPMVIVAIGAIYTIRYENVPHTMPPLTYQDIVMMIICAILPIVNIVLGMLILIHFVEIGWRALDRPIRH